MSDNHSDFHQLMDRVRDHSDGAARELIERYGQLILRVVRHHLNKQLRPKFDSVDFVQAVWASFFAMPDGRFNFEGPETLGGFLAQVARNKVVEVVRQRLSTLRYDVRREMAWSEDKAIGREPSAEELAIAREEWERILHERPPHHQQILVALRNGLSPRQIAEELGYHENSIRRLIRRLKRDSLHE